MGTLERWAPAQPFDFAGWTLLASAPSAERNLYLNLPTIYNAGGGNSARVLSMAGLAAQHERIVLADCLLPLPA